MKTKIFYIIIIFLFSISFINCDNRSFDQILKLSKSKELKSLLEYQVKIVDSPSKRYVFVYSIGAEKLEDEDILKKNALKKDYQIDGFLFGKGEYLWWFIYDLKKEKIVLKGSNLAIIGSFGWIETNNFFYFNFGTSPIRGLRFYDLNKKIIDPIKIRAIGMNSNEKLFEISKESKNIAYTFASRYYEEFGEEFPMSLGIKIKNIETNKDVAIIEPINKNNSLKIIRWESDNKLIYSEIDEKTNNETERSYIIK